MGLISFFVVKLLSLTFYPLFYLIGLPSPIYHFIIMIFQFIITHLNFLILIQDIIFLLINFISPLLIVLNYFRFILLDLRFLFPYFRCKVIIIEFDFIILCFPGLTPISYQYKSNLEPLPHLTFFKVH